MDKNSVIGFVLIFLILGGFTFYQSATYKKQAEAKRQEDAENYMKMRAQQVEDSLVAASLDSLAAAGDSAAIATLAAKQQAQQEASATQSPASPYKDSLLYAATLGEETITSLENDRLRVEFTTKGAQVYSALIKTFKTWDGEDLMLVQPGLSKYRVRVYAGEYISTDDFNFTLVSSNDTSVVMELPFSNGGRIRQTYTLPAESYEVSNSLEFIGMDPSLGTKVSTVDIDWGLTIPRLEKGYKNEKQYSKLDYYMTGDKKPEEIGRGRDQHKNNPVKTKWFAFQQQFFSAMLTADDEFASGDFSVKFYDEKDPRRNLMTCSAMLSSDIGRSNELGVKSRFYFGPNHFKTLKTLGDKKEKIIPLGGTLVGWISRFVIIPTFNFLHRFISNYGLIILLMTLMLKLVLSPLTIKSYMSSAKTQAIQPELDALKKKYPRQEDALKMQQAQMDLYKRAGINPMGGCLPMLLQFPLLWAMFRFFPASIELRGQSFLWCKDLSAYDSILDFGFNIPLFGDHLSLFALLMAVSMFFYAKSTMPKSASDDPSMKMMSVMQVWLMPIMMLFICNSLSAGLSYYYLLSNLVTIAMTLVIKKWVVKPEKIRAKLAITPATKTKKSKWQQRLEEAQRMQEQQMRKKK